MVSPQGNPFGKMPCRQGRLSVCRAFLHDSLLAITRAISELLQPPVPKIPEVKVEIVDTLVGICSKCGHEHRPYQPPVEGGKQTVDPSPPPPEAPPRPRPPESPTNVIEMRPRSIHHDDVGF